MKRMYSNLMLGLAAFIWGVAFVAQSVGMEYVGPFTFNAVRFLIGGVVLIPCIYLKSLPPIRRHQFRDAGRLKALFQGGRHSASQKRKQQKNSNRIGITGGICCGIALFAGSSLQQLGIMHTTVGKAGFITALYIVIVPVLGIFVKKKVGWTVWISVVIATIGMYLLCMTEGFHVGKGDLYLFFGAIAFSFHILVIDYFSPKTDGVFISCVQFFTAGVLAFLAMMFTEQPSLSSILKAWLPIGYAGVMSCGVAYTLQVVGQKNTDPTVAALILSLESAFSLLAGWVILGQKLSLKELFGCVLVFCAILLAQVPMKAPLGTFFRVPAGKDEGGGKK
ncbi:MAG: DMT family transporter [Hungatella sp.]|nr:DMT family transporter [Hungatella sp.]